MKFILIMFLAMPAAAQLPEQITDTAVMENEEFLLQQVNMLARNSTTTADAQTFQSSVTFHCPAGFTSIGAQGEQLGCMQTAEQNTGNWLAASTSCFALYGGMVPPVDMLIFAFANFTLTDENDDEEITSPFYYVSGGTYYYNTIDGNASPLWSIQAVTTVEAYRCWLPR